MYDEKKFLEKSYKEETLKPLSVSFGNSLFAGIANDPGACAYNFLSIKGMGYVLMIDKKDYVEHNNANLFFISPLSTLAALFASGEYFHSRSKAAISLKAQNTSYNVEGVSDTLLKDPTGVILITRDPLQHAQLFSKFIADNGRIIQLSGESTKKEMLAHEIKKEQEEEAKYYGALKVIVQRVPYMRRRSDPSAIPN
jgi:hypothetical protein